MPETPDALVPIFDPALETKGREPFPLDANDASTYRRIAAEASNDPSKRGRLMPLFNRVAAINEGEFRSERLGPGGRVFRCLACLPQLDDSGGSGLAYQPMTRPGLPPHLEAAVWKALLVFPAGGGNSPADALALEDRWARVECSPLLLGPLDGQMPAAFTTARALLSALLNGEAVQRAIYLGLSPQDLPSTDALVQPLGSMRLELGPVPVIFAHGAGNRGAVYIELAAGALPLLYHVAVTSPAGWNATPNGEGLIQRSAKLRALIAEVQRAIYAEGPKRAAFLPGEDDIEGDGQSQTIEGIRRDLRARGNAPGLSKEYDDLLGSDLENPLADLGVGRGGFADAVAKALTDTPEVRARFSNEGRYGEGRPGVRERFDPANVRKDYYETVSVVPSENAAPATPGDAFLQQMDRARRPPGEASEVITRAARTPARELLGTLDDGARQNVGRQNLGEPLDPRAEAAHALASGQNVAAVVAAQTTNQYLRVRELRMALQLGAKDFLDGLQARPLKFTDPTDYAQALVDWEGRKGELSELELILLASGLRFPLYVFILYVSGKATLEHLLTQRGSTMDVPAPKLGPISGT